MIYEKLQNTINLTSLTLPRRAYAGVPSCFNVLRFQDELYFGTLAPPLYSIDLRSLVPKYHGERLGTCQAMTSIGQVLIMADLESSSIVLWNTSQPWNAKKILLQDSRLQWINSLWIHDKYLWITHNNFHMFASYKTENVTFGIHRVELPQEILEQNSSNSISSILILAVASALIN